MQKHTPFPYQHVVRDVKPLPYCEFFKVSIKKISDNYSSAVAMEFIPKGALIIRDGGIVVSSVADVPPEMQYAVLIDQGLFLAPTQFPPIETGWYINHSCEPSMVRIGAIFFIAKRDIELGDELTVDYAPLISEVPNWQMECKCGCVTCRNFVTSDDWKNSTLAKSLFQEWLPHVQRKIYESGKE